MKRVKHLKPFLKKNAKPILFVAGFAAIGGVTIFLVKAASPSVGFEAENATLSNVSQVTDATASAGKAIQFGGSSANVPCALTPAAESCWAANTGVLKPDGSRWTEAQIKAGQSNLTHVTGKQVISTSGSDAAHPYIFENKWITGCIQVNGGVSHVLIRNVYVDANWPTENDKCFGGMPGSDAANSAISTGNLNSTNPPQDIVVQNVELNAEGTVNNGTGISHQNITLDHVNAHGGLQTAWVGPNAKVLHSYFHDISHAHSPNLPVNCYNTPNQNGCPDDWHRELIWISSTNNIVLADSYFVLDRGNDQSHSVTGAIFQSWQPGWGGIPATNQVISHVYADGGDYGADINAASMDKNSHIVWDDFVLSYPAYPADSACNAPDKVAGQWPAVYDTNGFGIITHSYVHNLRDSNGGTNFNGHC